MGSLEADRAAPQTPGGGKNEHPLLLSASQHRPWDCGMEPVTCDCFIFDKFNLDSNFYFSVAAFEEERGWLVLLSVNFTSGNIRQHQTS